MVSTTRKTRQGGSHAALGCVAMASRWAGQSVAAVRTDSWTKEEEGQRARGYQGGIPGGPSATAPSLNTSAFQVPLNTAHFKSAQVVVIGSQVGKHGS